MLRRTACIVRQVLRCVWSWWCFAISTFAIVSAYEGLCRLLIIAFYVRASREAAGQSDRVAFDDLLNWCWWMYAQDSLKCLWIVFICCPDELVSLRGVVACTNWTCCVVNRYSGGARVNPDGGQRSPTGGGKGKNSLIDLNIDLHRPAAIQFLYLDSVQKLYGCRPMLNSRPENREWYVLDSPIFILTAT